jgi:hypothetical protein
VTSVDALRKEARKNRQWASIYPGFRPDSLTRPLLTRGSRAFAANPGQLHRLCEVFLDSVGVADGKDARARFEEAAKLPDLEASTRELCLVLAETDARSLPRFAGEDDAAASPPAAQEAEPAAPEAKAPAEELASPARGGRRRTTTPAAS